MDIKSLAHKRYELVSTLQPHTLGTSLPAKAPSSSKIYIVANVFASLSREISLNYFVLVEYLQGYISLQMDNICIPLVCKVFFGVLTITLHSATFILLFPPFLRINFWTENSFQCRLWPCLCCLSVALLMWTLTDQGRK